MPETTKPGYTDSPIIPGTIYKVHDPERPYPPVVTPGRESSQAAAGSPPSDAVVLFDGSGLSGWEKLDGSPAKWAVEHGYMEVVKKTGDIRTKAQFGDCQLHVEWATPAAVESEGQGRGNSGVFLMGMYEIQVLDSFENPTYADGSAASLYGQTPPLVNACRKPGEWQTYDIVWITPRFEGANVISPARVTVFHNGVLVHHDLSLIGVPAHRQVCPYTAHGPVGPLKLQDHGNPVRYRNIWYRPLNGYARG